MAPITLPGWRALAWALIALTSAAMLAGLVRGFNGGGAELALASLGMLSLCSVPVWVVSGMLGSSFRVDEDGVTRISLLGRRQRIAWRELKRVRFAIGRGHQRSVRLIPHKGVPIAFSNARPGFWPALLRLQGEAEQRRFDLRWPLLGSQERFWSAAPAELQNGPEQG